MAIETFVLKLAPQEVDAVLTSLGQYPYNQVAQLVTSLRIQIAEQQEADAIAENTVETESAAEVAKKKTPKLVK